MGRLTRRDVLTTAGGAICVSLAAGRIANAAVPSIKLTGIELVPVRATSRTVWLFVHLKTNGGLTGLGEASDAFGFANTTAHDVSTMRAQLQRVFALIENRSPFDVAQFRERAWPIAAEGLVMATAVSAIEQAMWDLAGQALEVPTSALFGGRIRDRLPVYANINRAANPRTPDGFAAAARNAVGDGFGAVKAAPFDGFPPPSSAPATIAAAVDAGVAAVVAMRDAVGPEVRIMVDCHSFFDVELAVRVATRLEPQNLTWYEEPVAPERADDTLAIRRRIRQRMAGGELLFGVGGFAGLVDRHAVDVIMPDVKHCGGLLELTYIAAAARARGIDVAPHNPSGPVSTAASVHVAAGAPNVNLLELQYGEVPWRSDVVSPAERFIDGHIQVPDRPGLGVALNDRTIRAHALTL